MVKLLIIADDFTGALDTGVQFAACGATIQVVTDSGYRIENIDDKVQVLVMDAETRHLCPKDAYRVVSQIVKQACELEIPYIYKKTDSALRGNIGSELTALLEASGEEILNFIPAFPKMGRRTRSGIHYIEDMPVHESVFGHDPYEPVICSSITEMISGQSDINVAVVGPGEEIEATGEPTIVVYDVETDECLEEIAGQLKRKSQLHIMAGCAGFAAVLPMLLGLEGNKPRIPDFKDRFLVACGSVNPITRSQLDYAEKQGFKRIRITPEQKLAEGYLESKQGQSDLKKIRSICLKENRCILDTNDLPGRNDTLDYAADCKISLEEVRKKISNGLGKLLKELMASGVDSTILLTGGDTLLGFMNQIQVYEFIPLGEIAPGTVLSQFWMKGRNYEVISKSGGFGDEGLLVSLAEQILGGRYVDEVYLENAECSL